MVGIGDGYMRYACCGHNQQPSLLFYVDNNHSNLCNRTTTYATGQQLTQQDNNLRKHAFITKLVYLISAESYEALKNLFRVLTQYRRSGPDAGFGSGEFHRRVDELHAPTS